MTVSLAKDYLQRYDAHRSYLARNARQTRRAYVADIAAGGNYGKSTTSNPLHVRFAADAYALRNAAASYVYPTADQEHPTRKESAMPETREVRAVDRAYMTIAVHLQSNDDGTGWEIDDDMHGDPASTLEATVEAYGMTARRTDEERTALAKLVDRASAWSTPTLPALARMASGYVAENDRAIAARD